MTMKTGVIYLQKDKFQLYSPFLHSLVELRFTPDVVRDLDVLDSEKLEEQVKTFVTNSKINPLNLIIVLSDNAYFIKDFIIPAPTPLQPQKPGQPVPVQAPKVTLTDLKPQIDLFIEHVPYENVVSKSFPLKNGTRICAINKDLYASVESAFEKLGFIVLFVFPGMVLGNGQSAKPVMDLGLVNTTIQKAQALRQYDLKSQEAFMPVSTKEGEVEDVDEVQNSINEGKVPPKTNRPRLFAMIGLLIVLIGILIFVYMQSMQPPAQQPALAPNQSTTVAEALPVNTVAPTVTAIEEGNYDALSVQIVNTIASSSAQTLRTSLEAYKFKSVTIQSKTGVATSSTIVSFATVVNQTVRNTILDEVKKVKDNVTVQEVTSGANDITIILGR